MDQLLCTRETGCHAVTLWFQAAQLLVCDWLLSTRTAIWQQERGHGDVTSTTVSQEELLAFQQDLRSLRKLSQHMKAALPRVRYVYVFVSAEIVITLGGGPIA